MTSFMPACYRPGAGASIRFLRRASSALIALETLVRALLLQLHRVPDALLGALQVLLALLQLLLLDHGARGSGAQGFCAAAGKHAQREESGDAVEFHVSLRRGLFTMPSGEAAAQYCSPGHRQPSRDADDLARDECRL